MIIRESAGERDSKKTNTRKQVPVSEAKDVS